MIQQVGGYVSIMEFIEIGKMGIEVFTFLVVKPAIY